MSKIYYKKINSNTTTKEIQEITKQLLNKIIQEENIKLKSEIPMKVHFGEPGNITYVKPENYDGIIDFLKANNIQSQFMETSVVYGGKRYKKELHLETAKAHGFTRLPVIIADGTYGQDFSNIEINQKHYKFCMIGKEFENYNQILVISHFKGHDLAGFGGAIKQLSMGHAAKGGKLSMHMGIKPKIKNRKCIRCNLCKTVCPVNAITIGKESFINKDKCVGCGACVAICPHKAISIFSLKGIFRALFQGNTFREKLVEYALAAQKGKHNIYINFAMNITKSCDCVGKPMKTIMDDFGIFISTDPVAIDKACYDIAKENGKTFKGQEQFKYAEKIGLGSTKYELIEVKE